MTVSLCDECEQKNYTLDFNARLCRDADLLTDFWATFVKFNSHIVFDCIKRGAQHNIDFLGEPEYERVRIDRNENIGMLADTDCTNH